jgi:hypothetical protein
VVVFLQGSGPTWLSGQAETRLPVIPSPARGVGHGAVRPRPGGTDHESDLAVTGVRP